MLTLDELKNRWDQNKTAFSGSATLDQESLQHIYKSRIRKQKNSVMQYFWGSFTLQIIVYALLSHVAVRYWSDTPVLVMSIFCILLYVPFTFMLLHKYKRMAVLKVDDQHTPGMAVYTYVIRQYELLSGFYRFKKRYEIILIPLSTAIMIWIFFRIFIPGGIMSYPVGALLTFLITMISCIAAIVAENRKNFRQPLMQLENILQDLKQE